METDTTSEARTGETGGVHAEVCDMLEHLEDTFEYTTGWDYAHEDWYLNGEMTSWRRIQHPKAGEVTFKFVEDGDCSCCCVWTETRHAILYTRKEYDAFVYSLCQDFAPASCS